MADEVSAIIGLCEHVLASREECRTVPMEVRARATDHIADLVSTNQHRGRINLTLDQG